MIYINYQEIVMKTGRARWLSLLVLLHTFVCELPDIGSYQEVHHRLIALHHGEQLRALHVSASPRSPSHCFPHLRPERLLLVSPLPTVAEDILPGLGHRPASATAPPAFVVASASELF